jgi:hypothetical protein
MLTRTVCSDVACRYRFTLDGSSASPLLDVKVWAAETLYLQTSPSLPHEAMREKGGKQWELKPGVKLHFRVTKTQASPPR